MLEEDILQCTNHQIATEMSNLTPSLRFAKEPQDHKQFTSNAYTSSGFCMEMNDHSYLVQKVNGAVGGLSITLDALTDHYLPETVCSLSSLSLHSRSIAFYYESCKEY